MISIPGGDVRCCEGVSRREWIRVGGLGTLGLSLPGLFRGRLAAADSKAARNQRPTQYGAGFGRAKSCIVLFMFGAPAHQDTFDLKPDAPREMRGEFQPIESKVPGLFLGEHLPRLASIADQFALIRSVTHPDNTHTVAMHYMLTGVRHLRPETNPRNAPDDFPCFGSVVNYDHAYRRRNPNGSTFQGHDLTDELPAAVSLNAPANQVKANNHIFPGFFAGFLGAGFDPHFVAQNANAPKFQPIPLVEDSARLINRSRLLRTLERQPQVLERTASTANLSEDYARAFGLLTSSATRKAFALGEEPEELRTRYGSTPFGQGCLLARRLIERGVQLVTVNWERDDAFWDTHSDNFNLLKHKLLPNLDRGFSTLLMDLSDRGLLDDTLVVCLGEFGRTPQINANAGRDHWAACNTVVMAGAGIPGGAIYGASDHLAAYPVRQPVLPQDLSATIYHLLGIDPHQSIRDPFGRPYALSTGEPVAALL